LYCPSGVIDGICFFLVLAASCENADVKVQPAVPNNTNVTPIINYSVVSAYPHDTAAFTEGLLIHDGLLFESTGHMPAYLVSEPDSPVSQTGQPLFLPFAKNLQINLIYFGPKIDSI
jgi:glutamine cyclotransferase